MELLKWIFFYLLNGLADRLGASSQGTLNIVNPPTGGERKQGVVWVFCSTIGEFNACRPLLERLKLHWHLVLLTDHDCYTGSFHHQLPEATVVELTGRISDGKRLAAVLRPDLFVICEIPALPNDAPCRLSYALLRSAKRSGARLNIVNAWLYEYQPGCRMDAIERWLFTKSYLHMFDFATVQSEAVRDALISKGMAADKVAVSGNMKFDALANNASRVHAAPEDAVIRSLKASGSTIVVAGCLAGISECERLFPALASLKLSNSGMFFVLAPRHPENVDFMASFLELLRGAGLTFGLKSQLKLAELQSLDVLVLDTFGELQHYYAAADVCYVGSNHNILEPLSFGKPTVVSGQWDPMFPSYPVFSLTRSRGLVHAAAEDENLGDVFRSLLASPQSANPELILGALEDLSGAVEISYGSLAPD